VLGLAFLTAAAAILANVCALVAILRKRHGRAHVTWSAVTLVLCGIVVGLAVGVCALIRWGQP
jgi:hypothetical protein